MEQFRRAGVPPWRWAAAVQCLRRRKKKPDRGEREREVVRGWVGYSETDIRPPWRRIHPSSLLKSAMLSTSKTCTSPNPVPDSMSPRQRAVAGVETEYRVGKKEGGGTLKLPRMTKTSRSRPDGGGEKKAGVGEKEGERGRLAS